MNKATVGKDSRDAVRLAAKVDRHRSKMTDAREADADDAQVDINPDIVLSLGQKVIPQLIVPSTATKSKSKKGPVTKATARSTQVEDGIGSSDEEDNEAEHKNQAGRGPAAFKQRDLVARAFSGDDVVAVRLNFHLPVRERD
jgi:U3 small nucleolar RNA-associated protein 14